MKSNILAALVLALILTFFAVGAVWYGQPLLRGESILLFNITISPITVSQLPNVLSVLGVIIAVLIAYIVYLIWQGDARSEHIAASLHRETIVTNAHLRQLYDRSPVPYLTLMPDGTVHNPNLAAMRLYGMTTEELQGKELFTMHPEEDLERAQSLYERFRNNVPFEREEIRIIRKDGSVRWVMMSVFMFKVPGSRDRRGLVTLVDITEQKNLDRAKTEFVSLASHQLRTPLATVKWHTELLLSGKHGTLGEKQQEYIKKMRHANQAMVDLVNLLLNVSRIEMGTLQVDIQDTDVSALIADVLEELGSQITQKSLDVRHAKEESFTTLRTDPKLLRIVIQNLVSNAVKYTPEGGTVTIALQRQEGKHAIVVSDTGYGIPPEQQSMIFTKMFRADNVRKQSTEGTGLGLYLTKSIVELLGGSISFTSELNNGTTFTVLLP